MLKRILSALLLTIVVLYFSGCQTLHGLGGDLKWTGEQVEASAANLTSESPNDTQPK